LRSWRNPNPGLNPERNPDPPQHTVISDHNSWTLQWHGFAYKCPVSFCFFRYSCFSPEVRPFTENPRACRSNSERECWWEV
jgi:hypothetical protein